MIADSKSADFSVKGRKDSDPELSLEELHMGATLNLKPSSNKDCFFFFYLLTYF